jgi:hypothetical protein
MNFMMQGSCDDAMSFLASAPEFPVMQGSPAGRVTSMVIPAMRTRIHLCRGDLKSALEALPDLTTFTNVELSESGWREVAGEVFCSTGKSERGLPLLLDEIAEPSRGTKSNDPFLAHLRSTAALCAWMSGDRRQARTLSDLARAAFVAQPSLGDWFKQPLRRLDKLMVARSTA